MLNSISPQDERNLSVSPFLPPFDNYLHFLILFLSNDVTSCLNWHMFGIRTLFYFVIKRRIIYYRSTRYIYVTMNRMFSFKSLNSYVRQHNLGKLPQIV